MQHNLTTADVERVIKRLRSVLSVRVNSRNGSSDIDEIHVTVDEAHNPKQVSRDIESALMSELGVRIDHRKISIAQIRGTEPTVAAVRLQFTSISFSVDRQNTQAKVTLAQGDELFCGLASARSHRCDQLQLVATATLHAVEEYLYTSSGKSDGGPSLELESISRVDAGAGEEGVVVVIRASRSRGDEMLHGLAPLRQDLWRAAACATLDAVNRRLAWFVE